MSKRHPAGPLSAGSPSRPALRPVAAGLAVLVGSLAVGSLHAPAASAMDTGRAGTSIEQYLGVSVTGINRIVRRTEEMIAACMKREGFQYTPTAANIPNDASDAFSGNRKAFMQKYGYGISTFVEVPKPGAVDPNTAYVAKLSKADQRAYRVALIGTDPDRPDAQAAGAMSAKSCVGQAQRALFGDLAKIATLQSKFDDLDKRLASDAKVVKAVREWSACMKRSGYSYAKEEDVTGDLSRRLATITGSGGPLADVLGPAPDRIDVPGLKALQKDELAIAKVDWDCSVKHLGPRDELAKQLTKDFIDQNKTALEGLRKVLGS